MPRLARATEGSSERDDGVAIVDFVLVGALLTLVFVGVVQLALVLHVRNTLVDCASEGARYGAFADRTAQDGAQRTRDLIGVSISSSNASDVRARNVQVDGLQAVEVTVTAPLPVIGLFGPSETLVVSGNGAQEPP